MAGGGSSPETNDRAAVPAATPGAPPASTGRARLWIVAAALAFYALFVLRTSFTVAGTRYFVLFEDAMISMRYARHLAAGHGLVWNIGEPPIEGFTNLLWVLWMSVAHALGLSESKISLFIMLSGVAIMMATGLVTSKIARHFSASPWVPVAVLAATLFDYPLVFWTLRGMEVGALALLVYTLLWLALENEERFSLPRTVVMAVVTGAALLIRSDSVVPVGLICLYGFLFSAKRWLFAATVGTVAGAAVGGQMLFRRAYFHESLPNTYFLKLFHIPLSARVKRGAFVALEVLTMHLAVPIAIALASVTGVDRAFWKDKHKRRLVLLGALFTAQVGYATYVGGDAWEWMLYANRYMCIGMPALIVLVTVVLARLVEDEGLRAGFARRLPLAIGGAGLLLVLLNLYAKKFPEQGIAATIVMSKKALAIGAGLAGLGILMRLRDLRDGVPEALGAFARRLGSRHTVVSAALLLTALVWLPAHLLPIGQWAAQNAAQYADEAKYTRLGLLIRATTPPSLRMAVAAAGATPYFAERPTEDLLGKNDRHVAKLEPKGVFSPGHDKWDYAWSLGERKSDLIVEAVDVNPADEAYFETLGFQKLANEMRLRRDAPVDAASRELVGREMNDSAAIANALAAAGKEVPPSRGIDFAVVLAFALVIAAAARRIVKDEDPLVDLSPAPPASAETEDAPAVKAALAGANARAIPTLDGMRGIAVLLVLLFHFAWTFPGEDPAAAHGAVEKLAVHAHAFLWSGWTGVDLFFVLSGYLITRGLVAPSKNILGTRMKMFWMRRVLRIFPLYYAVVVVGSAVALAMGGYIPGLPYWLYMQNYALAFDPPEQALKWVAHFWSLAIEEQFYFVWPIVALTVTRKRLIPAILILVALVVVVRAGLVFKGMSVGALADLFKEEEYVKKFVYRATFTRADGLLLGAFVAVTQREALHPVAQIWRRLRLPIFVSTAVALAGLYVLANGLNDYDRRVMSVGYVALALLFASAVSMCADGAISERTRRLLSWRPLVTCGKVSYGMYIFHWPLVVLLVPWLEKTQKGMPVATQLALSAGVIVGGVAVVWVAAELSFRFFESRFLSLKVKFHD